MKETTLTYTGAEVQALLDKINNLPSTPSASNDSNQKVIVGRCVPEHAEPGKRYFSRKPAIKIDAKDLGDAPNGWPLMLIVYARVSSPAVFTVPAREEWTEFISRLREEARTWYKVNSEITIDTDWLPSSAYFREKLALWSKAVKNFASETTSPRVKVINSRLVIDTNMGLPAGMHHVANAFNYINTIKVAVWRKGLGYVHPELGRRIPRSKGFRSIRMGRTLSTFIFTSSKRLYCPIVWWRNRVRKTGHLIWRYGRAGDYPRCRVIK